MRLISRSENETTVKTNPVNQVEETVKKTVEETESHEPATKKEKRVRRKWMPAFYATGLVAATACSIYVGVVMRPYLDDPQASQQLAETAKAYRATGLPWEAKDLAPSPPVSTQENAAPLIQKAIGQIKSIKYDGVALAKTLRQGDFSGAKDVIDGFREPLETVVQASLKPKMDFHRDWDLGSKMAFPEYTHMSEFVKLLTHRAQIKASQHDFKGANEDLAVALRLGNLVGQDPIFIAMAVQVACNSMVQQAVQNVANSESSDASALADLDKVLKDFDVVPNPAFMLNGEAYMGLATLRNLPDSSSLSVLLDGHQKADSSAAAPPLIRTGFPTSPQTRAYLDRWLEAWAKIGAHSGEGVSNPRALGAAFTQQQEFLARQRGQSYSLIGPLFANLGPGIGELPLRQLASQLTAKALVEALEIRARTGKYPEKLADLPGKWSDPFTGKPLFYKPSTNGLRIYSEGEDMRDEGGTSKIEDPHIGNSGNIIAAFPPIAVIKSTTVKTSPKSNDD